MLQTTVLLSVSYPTLHTIPIQYEAICIYWNSNMTGLVWQESTLSISFLLFYPEPVSNPKAFQAAGLTELEDRLDCKGSIPGSPRGSTLFREYGERPRVNRTREPHAKGQFVPPLAAHSSAFLVDHFTSHSKRKAWWLAPRLVLPWGSTNTQGLFKELCCVFC